MICEDCGAVYWQGQPILCPSCVIEIFGGTFHAFDAWLETRPDLINVGTARQLDIFSEHEQRSNEIMRITREEACKG